jgi:N-acetylglutamate synthase-like GNAT family acetyltransferase
MNIRMFEKTDYPQVSQWWTEHKWPSIDHEHLPENGYIVEGYCAGFIYKTDSAFGLLEFVVANPKTDKDERAEALDLLLDTMIKKAKELKIKSLFTSLEHPKLIERYRKHGFMVSDTNMTNMIMRLR